MGEHPDTLRQVEEGDTVSLTTTTGTTLTGACVSREQMHADPRSGEVRETNIWSFEYGETKLIASIIDGLNSSPDDPDFPQHKPCWITGTEAAAGYIDELEVLEDA